MGRPQNANDPTTDADLRGTKFVENYESAFLEQQLADQFEYDMDTSSSENRTQRAERDRILKHIDYVEFEGPNAGPLS